MTDKKFLVLYYCEGSNNLYGCVQVDCYKEAMGKVKSVAGDRTVVTEAWLVDRTYSKDEEADVMEPLIYGQPATPNYRLTNLLAGMRRGRKGEDNTAEITPPPVVDIPPSCSLPVPKLVPPILPADKPYSRNNYFLAHSWQKSEGYLNE